MGVTTVPDHEFDVALSFAGEDRGYVHTVATTLRDKGVAVFYDEFSTVELWGQDLYSYLDDVYRNQSRYAVMFVSASYARNIWTSNERRSIQARVMADDKIFQLPVRLDDTELPGLLPTVAYLDGRRMSAVDVAELIAVKVGRDCGRTGAAMPFGVPLSPGEKRRVLAIRPAGWEFLVLAGTIWEEWDRLKPKRLDHELRYAQGFGPYVDSGQLVEFLHIRMDEFAAAVSKLEELITGDAFVRAMGEPGQPGNAVRIEHLGKRFGSAFEDILDWAARTRSTITEPAERTALELLARLADEPVAQVQGFVDDMVNAAGTITGRASARTTTDLAITVTLELTVAPAALDAFSRVVAEINSMDRRS